MDVLFLLILAHFCGDYAFQTDSLAERKKSSKLALTYHVLTYTACIWAALILYSLLYRPAVSFHTATLIFLIFIFIEHWLQDYLKHRINNGGRQAYYIDQVAHVTLLYLYRIFIFPG